MAVMFGLELLQKTVENDIKKSEDNIVVVFHWILLKHGFKCIGTGDAKEISGDEVQSELLPENWNACDTYLLRYICEKKLFIARILKSSDELLFHFIRGEDMKIASVLITALEQLDSQENNHTLIEKFEKELVKPIHTCSPSSSCVADVTAHKSMAPTHRLRYPQQMGRSDLDPFAAVYGPPSGMLHPVPGMRPPRIGIRYDPINPEQGPLAPRNRRPWGADPDPDEFHPPGGGYFM